MMGRLFFFDRNSGHKGTTLIGCLVFLILASVLLYVGFRAGKTYWNYFEVKYKIREALNWAVAGGEKHEAVIKEKIIVNATKVGVEINPQNIQIRQTTDSLIISVSWDSQIDLHYYIHPLKFDVTLTEIKRWHKGPLVVK